MKQRAWFVLTVLALIAALGVPPWLAFLEAQRQAYRAESDLALGYAKDVQRRIDETVRQALSGIDQLARSGYPPCSDASQALMRRIDLISTYIQAVGYVHDGILACSSISDRLTTLGPPMFRSSAGTTLYTRVPLGGAPNSPLIGFQRGDYAALFHRALPLDTWTTAPDVSLAVVHVEMRPDMPPVAQRGRVDSRWLSRLGKHYEATFLDAGYLVAVVRSRQYLTASIAAVPMAHVSRRTRALAERLVPAGILAGLALAAAVLLLARQQMSLANALRQGLRRDEFFLEYQPVVELATGRWVGAEALLRWRRSNGELIGPDLFIPVAEQSKTISLLTRRVLELVHRDVGDFLAHHPTFHIALNLSAADLCSPDIVSLLDALIARTHARPSNFIVEVTERALLDMTIARPTIATLRSRGIQVAVDDFGTGYSSLSYLQTLELDFLKIDRTFIEAIGTHASTNQVVQHIIAIGDTMDLRMIAEGVETDVQATYLVENAVRYGQGWHFAKPMSWAGLRATLIQHGLGSTRAAANMH